jgi:hypothetical protein
LIVPFDVLVRFVDRIPELARFQRMLSGEVNERILLVTEGGETGKTYFLLRLFHGCEQDSVPVALVDFDRRRTDSETDYLGVARAISRHLGEDCTPRTCACERAIFQRGLVVGGGAGDSGGVDLGEGSRFDEAEVIVPGRDYYQGIHIEYTEAQPTTDRRAQQMADMGRALRDDLASLAEEHDRIVLLMDTFEYAEAETCAWLERWLLEPMRHELSHVLLVVAGQPQCRSFFDRPSLWSGLIAAIDRFTSLDKDEVQTYYHQLGLYIPEAEMSLIIDLAQAGGPAEMARIGDLLMQVRGGAR